MASPAAATVDPELLDGRSAMDIFVNKNGGSGYTFDDLILMPGHIDFGVDGVK
ncbi:hypothetical protein BBJ28_00018836, partial [Nothophytophthora sp. Chile5]